MNTQKNILSSISTPVAILLAGIIIAGAVVYTNNDTSTNSATRQQEAPTERERVASGSIDDMKAVDSTDHILGDPNAPVKIVEYSDFECPFCKRFHGTMNQVMDEYGDSGQVAWVYRHFPLDQLHPKNARVASVASECVNEIAGNDGFWSFANRYFELTPSNDRTDIATVIPQIIGEIGVDKSAFNKCMDSGKYDKHIQDDIDNAIRTGGRGTPWSIVVSKDGQKLPLSGAQPYDSVKQLIDIALQ